MTDLVIERHTYLATSHVNREKRLSVGGIDYSHSKMRIALKPSSSMQLRSSLTASIGLLISAEPTPTRRPPDSAAKLATSSLLIMTLLGPYHADVSAVEIPAASKAATVGATSKPDFVQQRN